MAISRSYNTFPSTDDLESEGYNSDPDDVVKTKEDSDGEGQLRERRPSRIASVRTGSSAESRVSIRKQLELEAGNAIKYRTCSWQKVCRAQSF